METAKVKRTGGQVARAIAIAAVFGALKNSLLNLRCPDYIARQGLGLTMSYRNALLSVALVAVGVGTAAIAGESRGIVVLSGVFGQPGARGPIDIAARLQDLCGGTGASCDIWCAQSTFGGRDPGRHGLCRVIYRCPDGATRSTEAGRDEPILMRCPVDGDRDAALAAGNP